MPLDATGLTIPTVEELLADIATDQRDLIDPTIVTEADEPMGEVNGIVASHLREIYELAAVAYNALNRAATEDQLLDTVGSLTGTFRERSKYTKVTLTVNLDATFTLPAGARANVAGNPETLFETLADVTSTTAGDYTVEAQATELGPIVANAGTITEIATQFSGWNSVTNALDAVTGNDEELDPPYRLRQVAELYTPGSGSTSGIAADVLQVTGVEQCVVLENPTGTTDTNGVEPYGCEVVVYDGLTPAADDDAIAQAIFNSRAGGTPLKGDISGNATDELGNTVAQKFNRATVLELYLEFDLTVTTSYPGDTTFKATIAESGQAYQNVGVDVIAERLRAIALTEVAGVLDVTALRLDFAVSPTNTANLAVTTRQIAALDTSRIVVST